MKRLLLFLVLVVGCFGQDLNYTKGELNGLFWGTLASDNKVVFLQGVQVGNRLVPAWLLSDLQPTCSAPSQTYPRVSNGVLVKEVDMFYSNPANAKVPTGSLVATLPQESWGIEALSLTYQFFPVIAIRA